MDRLLGARQVVARSLGRIPDSWHPYAQCGFDFDGRAPTLLYILQVAFAFFASHLVREKLERKSFLASFQFAFRPAVFTQHVYAREF